MANARVQVDGREIDLGDSIVTCGRSSENTIAFPDDSNVSRYHAEIEKRPDGYWIIDLNSSNGTEVNGERLIGERPLADGDRVTLGGSSTFDFITADPLAEKTPPEKAAPANAGSPDLSAPETALPETEPPAPESGGIATEANAVSQGSKSILLVVGIICGIALLCVAGGAAAFYFGGGSKCEAKATITKPEAGDTIANPTEVEVETENTACVDKAVFTIDGAEVASTDSEPYTMNLDPSQFPDLADGLDHSLQIVLLDDKGQQIGQPTPVLLAFETRAVEKPEATPEVVKNTTQQSQSSSKPSAVTMLDTQQMSEDLMKQFRGGLKYNLSNKQFLQEVQKRAGEYALAGFFDRASVYRDAINVAYVREQNLDAPLGFILAMSRSKFVPGKQGDNEGLWQMSTTFATANGYNGLCGSETLSDQTQNCAAKASALYMKALVYGVFDGDPVYSVAAFGKAPQEAAAWKATLPADRSDVWNVIKTAPEREQLVKFFAAGIVALNPQKFGLKNDRSLEELYRVTM